MKICTQCGLPPLPKDVQSVAEVDEPYYCHCEGDVELEEFDHTELSDDGYDGDENSDYPSNQRKDE